MPSVEAAPGLLNAMTKERERPLRVLHLVAGNLYGGVESLLVTLARERNACPGMEPCFGLCYSGRVSRELEQAGAPVFLLGAMRVRHPLSVMKCRARLNRLIESERIGAVVFHSLWPYVLLGLGNGGADWPGVLWLHGNIAQIRALEAASMLGRPQRVIANSEFTARSAQRVFNRSKVQVLTYPVALPPGALEAGSRRVMRAELGAGERDVVIIQVSRLEAWKGHRQHLAALAALRDIPNWVCWMVGGAQRPAEQAYLRELEGEVERRELRGRVRFLGERNDVRSLLGAADIHCQPNEGPEPFGITFIEAMAAGLPLVTMNLGAAPELVDPSCGLLCEAGSFQDLAANLRKLIVNAELRQRLGQNGPGRAQFLCDPAERMRDLLAVLDECRAEMGLGPGLPMPGQGAA